MKLNASKYINALYQSIDEVLFSEEVEYQKDHPGTDYPTVILKLRAIRDILQIDTQISLS